MKNPEFRQTEDGGKYNKRIVILTPCVVSVTVHMCPGRSKELQPFFNRRIDRPSGSGGPIPGVDQCLEITWRIMNPPCIEPVLYHR
jgi:hypothetical protein